MRKLLLLLILAFSLGAGAQVPAFLSFSTAAPAASAGNKLIGTGVQFHLISWTISGGTLSSCSVRVDSSTDNSTWNAGDVVAAQPCTSNGSATVTNFVGNYIRINVTSASGGGTLNVVYTGYITNPSAGSNPVKGTGTAALGTSAIASGVCAAVVTAAVTGVSNFTWTFSGDVSGVTGYAPTANGILTIEAYVTANTLNWKVCNNTSASITPGAVTVNYTAF